MKRAIGMNMVRVWGVTWDQGLQKQNLFLSSVKAIDGGLRKL